MGHSYCRLLVHAVFSTKDRQPFITPTFQQRLYEYMAGIASNEFGHALRIGGTADHIHGLLVIRSEIPVAHAMNRWKSLSSGWATRPSPLIPGSPGRPIHRQCSPGGLWPRRARVICSSGRSEARHGPKTFVLLSAVNPQRS